MNSRSVLEVIVRVYNQTDGKGADLSDCGHEFKSGNQESVNTAVHFT